MKKEKLIKFIVGMIIAIMGGILWHRGYEGYIIFAILLYLSEQELNKD